MTAFAKAHGWDKWKGEEQKDERDQPIRLYLYCAKQTTTVRFAKRRGNPHGYN
jgi:hypothetical protein